jgi:hypothetical protein
MWAKRVWVRRVVLSNDMVRVNDMVAVQPGDVLDCIDITTSQLGRGRQRYRAPILRNGVYLQGMRQHHGDEWRGAGMLDRAPAAAFQSSTLRLPDP